MKRILIAAVAGAVILFIYGMVSWMVIPFHNATVNAANDEPGLAAALREHAPRSGFYVVPAMSGGTSSEAWSDMVARHEAGPIAAISVRHEGATPMSPGVMGRGMAINFVSALLVAFMLSWAAPRLAGYGQRLVFVFLLGVLIAIQSDFNYANWMWFPFDHTLAMALDDILGWLFVGLAQAAIIKPEA